MKGKFLKRVVALGVVLLACVGCFSVLSPASVYAEPEKLSDFLDYEFVNYNRTVITKGGELCIVVGYTPRYSNEFKLVYQPEYRKNMYDNWRGFAGSTDSRINAAYAHARISTIDNKYINDFIDNCYFRLREFFSGEGENALTTCEYSVVVDHKDEIVLQKAYICVVDNCYLRYYIFCGEAFVKGTEVRMRAQPNTDCDILGVFDNGEEVELLGYVEPADDWALVRRSNGREGYIFAKYLKHDAVMHEMPGR